MTSNTPTPICDQTAADLSALVDDELDAARRPDIEDHVRSCAHCAGVVQDLREIRRVAASLGSPTPAAHVWLEVAGQMRLDNTGRGDSRTTSTRAETALWQWIGIAAALVITTLAIYLVTTRRPSSAGTMASDAGRGNAASTATVESVQDDLQQAEALYVSAITKLEAIAKSDSGALSPEVAAKLQRSLTAIDTAIAESRSALGEHPESASARDSLFDALREKVGVLEQTVALINVMRNGDQSGAAQIVGRKSSS